MTFNEEVTKVFAQKLPEKLKETQPCMCGGVRHLLRVNDRFALYVHHGEEIKICIEKMGVGPLVGWLSSYYTDYAKLIDATVKEKGKVVEGGEQHICA